MRNKKRASNGCEPACRAGSPPGSAASKRSATKLPGVKPKPAGVRLNGVGSVAEASADAPPPDTVTALSTVPVVPGATSTVIASVGARPRTEELSAGAWTTSLKVHWTVPVATPEQLQPDPRASDAVTPAGNVSVTTTSPLESRSPTLETCSR